MASRLLLLFVLSRTLAADQIGIYFFARSFAETFAVLASFRLGSPLLRRVAADPAQAATHFAPLLGFRVVSTPIYLVCVTLVAVALKGEIWGVIVIVAVAVLLENISYPFSSVFLALGKVEYGVVIGVAAQTLFLTILLIGLWWAPSLGVLLTANLLRCLCLTGAAALVTQRWLFPLRIGWDTSLLKEGIPFMLLAGLAVLRDKADTLLLGALGTYDTVGHYQLALRAVNATLFVPGAVGTAFFAQLAARGLDGENRRALAAGGGFIALLGLSATAVVTFAAPQLSRFLYGSMGAAVAPLLHALAWLFPLSFLHFFLSSALQALRQETKTLWALAIGTSVSLATNCVLIPHYGAYGAICAQLLSAITQLAVLAWYLSGLLLGPKPRAALTA